MGRLPSCVGIVLAGGKSRRFGRPKAWAKFGESSFVERLYLLLRETFGQAYVVLHEDSAEFAGMETLVDRMSEGGPMNGIYSALAGSRAPAVFVAACDLPRLGPPDIERLLQAWRPEFPALVYRRRERWEPLCGIYHSRLLPALRQSLEIGRYGLQEFLTRNGAAGLEYSEEGAVDGLANVNTPEEYRELIEGR
ncbi:MAG TPA: molybdenum cofactor guanylyltransferase [bacterium]|nr:molybdenum cofactor guanylyltransferase [bacterium]